MKKNLKAFFLTKFFVLLILTIIPSISLIFIIPKLKTAILTNNITDIIIDIFVIVVILFMIIVFSIYIIPYFKDLKNLKCKIEEGIVFGFDQDSFGKKQKESPKIRIKATGEEVFINVNDNLEQGESYLFCYYENSRTGVALNMKDIEAKKLKIYPNYTTIKDYVLDSIACDNNYGECLRQIYEYFEQFYPQYKKTTILSALDELLEEGLIEKNHTWRNEHNEIPYMLTDKGKEIVRQLEKL